MIQEIAEAIFIELLCGFSLIFNGGGVETLLLT